jgi:hypothetical protein
VLFTFSIKNKKKKTSKFEKFIRANKVGFGRVTSQMLLARMASHFKMLISKTVTVTNIGNTMSNIGNWDILESHWDITSMY